MLRRKSILIPGVIALILAIGLVMWSASRNSAPEFLAGLSQNAYDDFVRAGNPMAGFPDELMQDFMRTNHVTLDLLRRGLGKRFEAPAETYSMETFGAIVMPNMALFKRLGQTLKAAGKNAEEEAKFAEAASIYLDLIQFGQKAQAGPVIFCLIGLAVEDMGLRGLQNLESNLNGSERAQVASKLEQLVAERLSFEEILKRERYFGRRNSPTPFHYLISVRMSRPAIQSAHAKYDRQVKAERDFIAKLRSEAKQP